MHILSGGGDVMLMIIQCDLLWSPADRVVCGQIPGVLIVQVEAQAEHKLEQIWTAQLRIIIEANKDIHIHDQHCHNCQKKHLPVEQNLLCVEAVPVVKVRKDWLNGIELI